MVAMKHEVPVPGIKHESSSSMGRQPKHANLEFEKVPEGIRVMDRKACQGALIPWGNMRYYWFTWEPGPEPVKGK